MGSLWIALWNYVRSSKSIRSFPSGGRVCNLSLATSETWKDRNSGERKEKTEWHRIAVFSEPLVGVCERFLRKGSKVYVEGQLETRKWQDQSGQDRYTTEIVLRPYRGELTMLDSRQDSGGFEPAGPAYGRMDDGPSGRGGPPSSGPGGDLDDEIPF